MFIWGKAQCMHKKNNKTKTCKTKEPKYSVEGDNFSMGRNRVI